MSVREKLKKIGCGTGEMIPIVLVLVVVIVDLTFIKGIHYTAGLKGNPFYAMKGILVVLFLLGMLLVTAVMVVVNLIRTAIHSHQKKKMEWGRLAFSVFPVLLGLFLYFGAHKEAGAVNFLRGYEKWVQKEVDITAIQEWLVGLDTGYSEKYYFDAEEFPEELPVFITKLEPQHMDFSKFDKDTRCVEFEWGSALGHWGIRIGLAAMETPKGEECIKIEESEWEYRRPIQPGVYIFDRG
jgi:hypothetical protein